MKNLIILLTLLAPLFSFAQEEGREHIVYVCPPCDGECDKLEFDQAGSCSHCGMQLVEKNTRSNKLKIMTIAFYLQDGVEILDFAGPMEVFAYSGYEVFTVSKTKDPIKTQGIMTIIPDYSIDNVPQADILAFFGGNSREASGDPDVINWIKSQEGIDHYFSVCTGAFILGESGILKDKTATTFHNALDNLEENFPDTKVLKNVRFVDNGNVITTAGISAGIDGALHLVAKQKGLNIARKTAYYMEYDKWIPGEGVILAEQNPYKDMPDLSYLNDFTGSYENDGDTQLVLHVNKNTKSLYALINEKTTPLLYLSSDIFITPQDKQIIFIRNNMNEIVGYKLAERNEIYKKIK